MAWHRFSFVAAAYHLVAQTEALRRQRPTSSGPSNPGWHDVIARKQPKACPAGTSGWGGRGTIGSNCPHMFRSHLQTADLALKPHGAGQTCPTFYISLLGQRAVKQRSVRQQNVASMAAKYPEIRTMGAISWRDDWGTIKSMFKRLKLPVCFYSVGQCGRKVAGIGKYGRWASLIMAYAYQVRFELPCMVLLEDDVELNPQPYEEFRSSIRSTLTRVDDPKMIKCGQWGECLATNLAGAKTFLERIYEYSVASPSDEHIIRHMSDITRDLHSRNMYKLLVESNAGDIAQTPEVEAGDFDYSAVNSAGDIRQAVDAFVQADVGAHTVDLVKAARAIAVGS